MLTYATVLPGNVDCSFGRWADQRAFNPWYALLTKQALFFIWLQPILLSRQSSETPPPGAAQPTTSKDSVLLLGNTVSTERVLWASSLPPSPYVLSSIVPLYPSRTTAPSFVSYDLLHNSRTGTCGEASAQLRNFYLLYSVHGLATRARPHNLTPWPHLLTSIRLLVPILKPVF